MAKNRLLLIDLMKVLGIVLIVANHPKYIFKYFSLTIPIYNNIIIDWGYIGVDVYFYNIVDLFIG